MVYQEIWRWTMVESEGRDYKEEIGKLVDEFRQKMADGTRSGESFLKLSEIESLWGDLRHGTNDILSDVVAEALSGADEAELVRKKKRNTDKKA
jgi:hypothetical protein